MPVSEEEVGIIKRLSIVVLQTCLIVAAVYIGRFLSEEFNLIPRAIIRLPEVDYSESDFRIVVYYFSAFHFILFGLVSLFNRRLVFFDVNRSAFEGYVLVCGISAAALGIFVTTNVPFSPELMMGTALSAAGLFLLAFLVIQLITARVTNLWPLVKRVARLVFSVIGIVAIVFACTPIVLAKVFTTDREVANQITKIRIFFSQLGESKDWALVNALGNQRFMRPIDFEFPLGDDKTLYVLERDGALYRVYYAPPFDKELVLNIKDRLGPVEVENGALGIALHPDFAKAGSAMEGRLYLYYTDWRSDPQINRLVVFDTTLPTVEARTASEQPLIELERSNDGFHNGGCLDFGPDGFLYITIGESSAPKVHQTIDQTLFGGILRIDVDNRDGDQSHTISVQPQRGKTAGYSIPNDNPFVGRPGALEEFWAMGLRNPWRFTFDKKTGEIWVGDVGSTVWEEVNKITRGGNYQYPYIEGWEATGKPKPAAVIGTEVEPIHSYRHTAYDRSVIGGMVYRSDKLAALTDRYIFADNYSGKVMSIPTDQSRVTESALLARITQVAQYGVTTIRETPDGDIFMSVMGAARKEDGFILKLVPADQATAEQLAAVQDTANGDAEDVESIFAADCARCHGLTGDGKGPDAADLEAEYNIKMVDFTASDYHGKRTSEEIRKVILQGGPAIGLSEAMPPWEGMYSDAMVDDLVEHVKGFHH